MEEKLSQHGKINFSTWKPLTVITILTFKSACILIFKSKRELTIGKVFNLILKVYVINGIISYMDY